MRAACDAAGLAFVTSLIDLPSSDAAYREAVAQASRDGANAIMVGDNPGTLENRALVVNLIGTAGIPAMYPLPEFVDEGGLIAYSFDLVELNRRAASDIDRHRRHPARRKSRRDSLLSGFQIRTIRQPQDREGTWAHRAGDAARQR